MKKNNLERKTFFKKKDKKRNSLSVGIMKILFDSGPRCSSLIFDKLKERGYTNLSWEEMYNHLLNLEKTNSVKFHENGRYELTKKGYLSFER